VEGRVLLHAVDFVDFEAFLVEEDVEDFVWVVLVCGPVWSEFGSLQLPYVAATCKTPLPTPSLAVLSICATSSVGLPPDLEAVEVMSASVSSSSEVLLRRHDSKMSSRGDAP
jgi:hypothetical protein